MPIFDRIATILKANIHDLLDKAEDPEKMIHQLLREMEEEHDKAKEQVAEAIAQEKKMERDLLAARALVEQWHVKAATALRAGDEALAREALARKLAHQKRADALQQALEEQTEAVTRLKEQLHALEAKIEDAKRQKDVLLARQKRVEAEQQIRQTMSTLTYAEDAFRAFERIKDKIEDQELVLEALREMEAEVSTQARFEELEADQELEQELAALKAELGGEAPTP
ncbi:MAG: PspA/IM30 family protein [Anaerolineae bacterium]|nr:PspA/IM30 family protein [Anaerolineae bacterium]